MSLIDSIRHGRYTPTGGPLAAAGHTTSLAETAMRIVGGVPLLDAARDFLDQVPRASHEDLGVLIGDAPPPTGSAEGDALLAGIAEHLAATRGLPCPRWTSERGRFLDRFWFVSAVAGFRAISLAQSPVALKRRGILWPSRSLERV